MTPVEPQVSIGDTEHCARTADLAPRPSVRRSGARCALETGFAVPARVMARTRRTVASGRRSLAYACVVEPGVLHFRQLGGVLLDVAHQLPDLVGLRLDVPGRNESLAGVGVHECGLDWSPPSDRRLRPTFPASGPVRTAEPPWAGLVLVLPGLWSA